VEKVHSMRKAQAWLKKNRPEVVVAEFHFDPELRDRMSNLESLIATLQRYQNVTKVIVFIDSTHRQRLAKLQERFAVFGALDYPIDEVKLSELLQQARQ
jgi:AmiR/NasT family two-component response regulator